MKQKLIYAGVIVAVVGATLLVWSMWSTPNNANFPEGTAWLCTDNKCGNHFKMTVKELAEYTRANYGQPVKCPKCQKVAVGAIECAHCGKVYHQMRGSNICPYCNKPQPPPKMD